MIQWTDINPKSAAFLKQVLLIAEQSKDNSTKVGALIVNPKGRALTQGRNGFPQGVNDTITNRDMKILRTLHAELNAILFAQQDLEGCTMYITAPPCAQCMAAMIQVGITTVICFTPEKAFEGRWKASCDEAELLADEARIDYIQVKRI